MATQVKSNQFTFTETWETISDGKLQPGIPFFIPGAPAAITIHRDPIDTINLRYKSAVHVREGATFEFTSAIGFTVFSIITESVNTNDNTIEFSIFNRKTRATTSLREFLPLSPSAPSSPRVYTAPADSSFSNMNIVVKEQGGILIRTIEWK